MKQKLWIKFNPVLPVGLICLVFKTLLVSVYLIYSPIIGLVSRAAYLRVNQCVVTASTIGDSKLTSVWLSYNHGWPFLWQNLLTIDLTPFRYAFIFHCFKKDLPFNSKWFQTVGIVILIMDSIFEHLLISRLISRLISITNFQLLRALDELSYLMQQH